MCPRDFVHVTVLGVPSRATSGRGRAEPRHRCNSAPVAGGKGVPGRQAQRWDRPVTGESLPRTEYLEIVRQQIRHPKTSQKAPQEFREERAVKPRKLASILSQSSSPLSGPLQGDLETTPAASLASRSESRVRSHGWVTGSVCLRSHTQRCAGVCQTLSHFSRFEALWRSDDCSLFPSLMGALWCAEVP